MSFADLRSMRKSKDAKSFVRAPTAAQSPRSQEGAHASSQDNANIRETVLEPPPVNVAISAPLPSTSSLENLPIRSLPATLEVRKSPASGRGIYATQNFGSGSVLISLRPRAAVLSTTSLDTYCSCCAGPAPQNGLKRCTRCRTVYYCDSNCQNNDWSLHKSECNALQSWATAAPSSDVAVPSDAVRCIGRILWNVQKKGLDSEWTKELNMLQSHRASLQPSAFESYTHLAHSVVRYLGATSPADLAPFGLSSAGDLVDLISRFTTNAFTLTSFSLAPIGVCYSPTLALVNHSCEPNAVIVFPRSLADSSKEPNMQLVAIKPIASEEQVFISYLDTTLPTDLRQKMLQETYDFVCKCALCCRNTGIDPRSSLGCPNSCGGTCPSPIEENDLPRCSKCKTVVKNADVVLDALRIGQEALDKATKVQFSDPSKARQLTTNIIPILARAGLTPSSHPLLAMTRLHREILIASLSTSTSEDILDETVQTAAKYVTGLSDILTYGHPVRAVALAELGKLLAVDEPSPPDPETETQTRFPPSGPPRLQMAYETLLRARGELLIGFGAGNEGGKVGTEVREILVKLERELGVWTEGIRNTLQDTQAAKPGPK